MDGKMPRWQGVKMAGSDHFIEAGVLKYWKYDRYIRLAQSNYLFKEKSLGKKKVIYGY